MRNLKKPNYKPEIVFLTCINNYRDADLKRRLQACEQIIISASAEFDSKVSTAELHTIEQQTTLGGLVTADEMVSVYTSKMAKKEGPGRVYYDKLKLAPVNSTCPLCGQRKVMTLDHHLSKKKYPALAVAPLNLIPCCSDCNKKKLDESPSSSEYETIHPYYDNVDDDRWLYAEVIQTSPVTLRYFVNPPFNWDDVKNKRLKHHFEMFNLGALYSSEAATELMNIRYANKQLFECGGAASVRQQLFDSYVSRMNAFLNSWQTAMYQALAESDWYCDKGVLL